MADKVQLRRDTAARWAQFNPVLSEGEVGYVTDNPNQYKIGDGIHAWNKLPLRGFNGTLVQETGDDENAVMSQKSVTRELFNLKSISQRNVFSDNVYTSIIKELYLYKEDGSDISKEGLIVKTIYNKAVGASGDIKFALVLGNSRKESILFYNETEENPKNGIIKLSNSIYGVDSGYRGYCILNFDVLSEEGMFMNLNSVLKLNAFDLDKNPSISSLLSTVPKINSSKNGIIYANDIYSSSLIKELYIYDKNGDEIPQLYVRTIYNNANSEIKFSIVISGEDKKAVLYYNETAAIPKTGVIELTSKNSNLLGYAILSFDTTYNPLQGNSVMGKLNSNCFDLDKNPSIKEYVFRKENTQYKKNIDKIINNFTEVNLLSRINNFVDGQYINESNFNPVVLKGFQYVEIDVTDVYKVKFYAFFGQVTLAVGFKDADGNIVGEYYGPTGPGGYYTFEAEVPASAKYAYSSYRCQDGDKVSLMGYVSKINLYESSKNLSYEWLNMYNSEDTEHILDQYLNNNLIMKKMSLFEALKIKCFGAKRLRIKAFFGSDTTKCAFQDQNGNFIAFGNKDGKIIKSIPGKTGYDFVEVLIPDNAYYVLTSYRLNPSFGDSANILLEKLVDKVIDKPFNLANVTFIPIFGQSLSVGTDAKPPITTKCKYPAAIMFNTGVRCVKKNVEDIQIFQPLVETESGETVASGCAEKLIELISENLGISPYDDYWSNHKFLFATLGTGSSTIFDLTSKPEGGGMSYYDGIVNAITAAKNICDSYGWTLNVPAWIWMQGERDMYLETTNYKEQLSSLASQLNEDAKRIVGQNNNSICVCYQTGSQNIWGNNHIFNTTRMDVPNDQMELIRDNNLFAASIPVYALDHSSEPIHLSAVGEKMCGLYNAISISQLLEGRYMKGVTPISYIISDTKIEITFNVPCPPLIFDTTFVKEVKNMGFSVLKKDNSDIVSNVEIFDDKVTITCSENPSGCKLFYGLNGTTRRDGRIEGARGNLSDNSGKIYNGNIKNKVYSLSNYCYCFVILLK